MQEIIDMLFEKDDVTWQSMIYELVRTEQMDPWDIDISVLSARFLDMVKKLKKLDFRISGKIILAAAVLLRIKSSRLLEEDLNNLNRLIAMSEEHDEDFFEDLHDTSYKDIDQDKFRLIPRTPQPRKRKVSVFDLVEALQKALEVKQRRIIIHDIEAHVAVPLKPIDITVIIEEVYKEIRKMIAKHKLEKIDFTQLVPSGEREDKVYTIMPLLYLDTQQKISLTQSEHLGNIEICLR